MGSGVLSSSMRPIVDTFVLSQHKQVETSQSRPNILVIVIVIDDGGWVMGDDADYCRVMTMSMTILLMKRKDEAGKGGRFVSME